jgi:hypothetical protein
MFVRARVSLPEHRLEGAFAIDLDACAGEVEASTASLGSTGRLTISLDLQTFRREVFKIIAHEYLHVIQHWLYDKAGDAEGMDKAYTAEYVAARHEVLETAKARRQVLTSDEIDVRVGLANERSNRFEVSAVLAADDALRRLKNEIYNKSWDPIFPLETMNLMVWERSPNSRGC